MTEVSLHLVEPYAPRPVRPFGLERHEGWVLKLYEISYRGSVSEALKRAARQAARDRLPLPAVTPHRHGIGFMGAHEGRGGNFVFLDWWAQENELHHHVWFSGHDAPEDLREAGPADPVACCWDLSVICHERAAWVRHVLAHPDEPDIDAYLSDVLDAEV